MERANHQTRTRDHDRTAEKHWMSPSPHSRVQGRRRTSRTDTPRPVTVTIRVETAGAAVNLGPRSSFRCRATLT